MHFVYGLADTNAGSARRLYTARYYQINHMNPDQLPNKRTFSNLYLIFNKLSVVSTTFVVAIQ